MTDEKLRALIEEFDAEQRPEEVTWFYRRIEKIKPKVIVELGVRTGGNSKILSTHLPEDGLLIGVDWWRRCEPPLPPATDCEIHFVSGDSHASTTIERVIELLGGREIDLLFIDGDHSKEGMLQDYEDYGPLVRQGGIIAVHDIYYLGPVWQAWAELCKQGLERYQSPWLLSSIGLGFVVKGSVPVKQFRVADTSEEVQKNREGFYASHDDASGWQHYDWVQTEDARNRLVSEWSRLINTQNGRDLDDYNLLPGINKIDKMLLRHVPDKQSKVVLLGTGTGREVAHLKNLGYPNSVGVSLGPRNKKFSTEVVGLSEEDILFEDMHFLSLENDSVDTVAGFQVIEHALSPLLLLLECNRILKPGGALILQTPNPTTHTGREDLHHLLCPIPLQMRGLLLKSGFEEIHCFIEGDGSRPSDYRDHHLTLLPQDQEHRADIEYLVVCTKKNNVQDR